MSVATAATSPPSGGVHDQLVERARELGAVLAGQAPDIERRRSVPPETIGAIIAGGIARCLTPRRFGGYELGFETAAQTTIELARGDASTAWCAMFLSAHAWIVCHYDEAAQAEVFADGPDPRVAAIFAPMGRFTRVEGGYRVTGDWPWSSGIEHANWMVGGGFVDGEAPPRLHFALFDASQFSWTDTWHNVGLRGTGSHTSHVVDAFVPEHRMIPWEYARDGIGPGVESLESPIYRAPFVPPFYALLGAVALGAVRGAYERAREWTKERTSSITQQRLAEDPPTQIAMTETAAEIDAAQLLLDRCISRSSNPAALDYRLRLECRRDANLACRLLVQAIDRLMSRGGARGLYDANPLQRTWRDVHAIAGHVVFNFDAAGEAYGRLELGLEPPPRDPYF